VNATITSAVASPAGSSHDEARTDSAEADGEANDPLVGHRREGGEEEEKKEALVHAAKDAGQVDGRRRSGGRGLLRKRH
jgi:hypothetical protein